MNLAQTLYDTNDIAAVTADKAKSHFAALMVDTKGKFWKVFRIGTVRYNCPMSAHASQAFSIVHCTDSEDLPNFKTTLRISADASYDWASFIFV